MVSCLHSLNADHNIVLHCTQEGDCPVEEGSPQKKYPTLDVVPQRIVHQPAEESQPLA